MCRRPTAAAAVTPVDENQSLTSTPRSPSRKFDGGVDVARAAERRREHRRKGAAALADARRLDFGAEPDDGEIGIVLDRALNRLVQRQLQRLGCLVCADAVVAVSSRDRARRSIRDLRRSSHSSIVPLKYR